MGPDTTQVPLSWVPLPSSLEYPNTTLAHMHDIEFDAKHCILEHFLKWVKRIILHCYSIDRDIHLAPRVGPTINSIIAQKLRTASLRGEPSENAQLTHEHHSGVKYC